MGRSSRGGGRGGGGTRRGVGVNLDAVAHGGASIMTPTDAGPPPRRHSNAFTALLAACALGLYIHNHHYQPPAGPRVLLARPPHAIPPASFQHRRAADEDATGPAAPTPLTPDQVDAYFRDGFLVLPRFFESHLPALRGDVEGLIDSLAARLHRAGVVNSTYADAGWTERLLLLTHDFPDAPLVLTKGGVLPEHFQRLYADPSMLDIAHQLGVGPAVAVNAAWNLRAKMQKHEETTVPWHQDNSYWEPRIWDEHVITVWVSLVDASVANGCMQFVRGGHRSGNTARHTIGSTTRTWYTELSEADMQQDLLLDGGDLDVFTAEVPAGTAILFPGTTPHRSLNSVSDRIRWSTDYRLHGKSAKRKGASELDWFYGLKDSLLLRRGSATEEAGGWRPAWSEWANVDRTTVQDQGLGATVEAPFDPVIVGPWMDLWNLTAHRDGGSNRHLERYLGTEGSRGAEHKYMPHNW